jgi:hypothetical protein
MMASRGNEADFVHLRVHSETRMGVGLPDPIFEPLVTLIEARCLAKLQAVAREPRLVSKEKLSDPES